jgi:hypothetical protein
MPDQLPSAILDSTNSFDSSFALDLDTKQRFDNILSGQQKPIDYPLPDFQKEMYPNGLPQDDLLNPTKMSGSIGQALFSTDPRIADYAVSKMRDGQSRLPVNQGVGVPDRFEYAKVMDKYLKGDFGYNPYESIEQNEDFNYRYDYLNQGLAERIFKNVGVGLSRFVGSVVLKLGQTVGYMGSLVGNGVEEIFNAKDNHFMSDVADNSLSRWFEGLEEDMKTSNLLSVFKPAGWEDKGFFSKLGNGAFWTDEVADGAAFMGEMVASMYLLGGLGKIGALGRLGATEINMASRLGKFGKVLDAIVKTGTGAEDLSGVGRWAFATTSESAFEASNLYKTRKEELRANRNLGKNSYTDEEINLIAGDSAAASFKANMLILSVSNAFENKFIFNPLFKKLGVRGPNPRGGLINVSRSVENLDDVARASRRNYNYSTWLGKRLDWKNSNSRLRFYGSRGLSATIAEGFWEENAQLAVERLAGADQLTLTSFAQKLKDQTLGAIEGTDPEASTNIGLGGLIGIGGTSIIAKVAGGEKRFQGERRKVEVDTQKAISIYEKYRKNFLSFQDIYVTDPATGKPVMDSNGNLQIDETKAAGVLDGLNKFTSKQAAADKVSDPLLRKYLQDNAMIDYVVAAKNAGIFDRAVNRFQNLESLDGAQIENLGFDPVTTTDAAYLKDSIKEMGKIYDSVYSMPKVKGASEQDEILRKNQLFVAASSLYSTNKLLNEYQSVMMDRDFPSVFAPDAEANSSEVQEYNSLIYQEMGLNQFADMAAENSNFYDDYVAAERSRITKRKQEVTNSILLKQQAEDPLGVLPGGPKIVQDQRGFYYAPMKYAGYSKIQTSIALDQENEYQKKHAEMTNVRNQNQFLVDKFKHPTEGVKNTKAFRDHMEEIQKKDAIADAKAQAAAAAAATPPTAGPTTPTATATPTAPVTPPLTNTEIVDGEKVITKLTSMLSAQRAVFIVNDPNNLPDYASIIDYIEDNEQKYDKEITATLLDFLQTSGDVILDQVAKGTFNPINIQVTTFKTTLDFMDKVVEEGLEDKKTNLLLDYIESVQKAMDNYVAPTSELTEDEVTAVTAVNNKDLSSTGLAKYAAVLRDENSTSAAKKEALRAISDQLFAASTAEETGTQLGRAASDAIENLNYPAPVENEALAEVAAGAATAATNPALIAALNAELDRLIDFGVQATQARRDELIAGGMTYDEAVAQTQTEWRQTDNGIRATEIEELLGESPQAATPTASEPTPAAPLTKEQQIEAFFAGITADAGSKAKIRQYADRILAGEDPNVVLAGLGPSFVNPVNDLVALESKTETPATTVSPEDDLIRKRDEELEPLVKEKEELESEITRIEKELEEARKVVEETRRTIEENVTEPEVEELRNELNVDTAEEVYNAIQQELAIQSVPETVTVEQITEGTIPAIPLATRPKLSLLQKIVNRIKKALLMLFAAGTIWTGISAASGITSNNGQLGYDKERALETALTIVPNRLAESAANILPESKKQEALRFLEKIGKYESKDATIEVVEDLAPSVATQDSTVFKPTIEILSVVADSYNPTDSLLAYRSTWHNESGFDYIAGPNKTERQGKNLTIPGVLGVGHFLLDGSVYNFYNTYSHPYNQSFLASARANNDYIPVFTSVDSKKHIVVVRYLRPNEIDDRHGEFKIVAPLRQFKASQIDWNRTGPVQGFKSNIKQILTKTGQKTNLIFKDRNGYSRFSGGSVVFIFEKDGQRMVIDFAGSINMIQNETQRILRDYEIPEDQLTIGYHDVGSFSAKPKSKGSDLQTSQYEGYNPAGVTGASLLIPMPEQSGPVKSGINPLMGFALLGLIRRKRNNGEPITSVDLDALKTRLTEVDNEIREINNRYAARIADLAKTPEPEAPLPLPVEEEKTQADETRSNNSENSTEPPTPPAEPPTPPTAPENSDAEAQDSDNYIDVMVDEAKKNGIFTFPQNIPAEVVMEGEKPKIVNGVVQLKTTLGDQQEQLLRQHNVLREMGNKNNPINFWSEDDQGQKMFRIKLLKGDEALHVKWIYQTAKGLKDYRGRSYGFPYIIAVVTDRDGEPIYFTTQGKPTDRIGGQPFAFPYVVQDYLPDNLYFSRRGIQLGTNELLNGNPDYSTDNPLGDVSEAVIRGVNIFGDIDTVTSGKLSGYNVNNSPATYAQPNYTLRTVKQMIDSGDIQDDSTFLLKAGNYFEYTTDDKGKQVQQVKVGQPTLFDPQSGMSIPLRGKKIKDLTLNGKPLIDGALRTTIEGFQRDKEIELEENFTPQEEIIFNSIYNFLRSLVYSKDVFISMNPEGNKITLVDNRPTNMSLMETEVNYTSGIQVMQNPFVEGEEGEFSYKDFISENFLSGALPAEVESGQKSFEKLNKRIIFTLEKTHKDILDSIGTAATARRTVRVQPTDYSKFVGKTYKRKGGTSTITVLSYNNGLFTIKGDKGEVTKSAADFMKDLKKLEEVNLPVPTEEVLNEMQKDISLSKEDIERLNEQAKNMTDQDVDNLDFGC